MTYCGELRQKLCGKRLKGLASFLLSAPIWKCGAGTAIFMSRRRPSTKCIPVAVCAEQVIKSA